MKQSKFFISFNTVMMEKYFLCFSFTLILLSCGNEEDPVFPDIPPQLAKIQGKMVISSGYNLFLADPLGIRDIPAGSPTDELSAFWGPNGGSIWYLGGTDFVSTPLLGWQNVSLKRKFADGTMDTTILQSHWPDTYNDISISPDEKYLTIGDVNYLYLYHITNESELILDATITSRGYDAVSKSWWSPDSRKFVYPDWGVPSGEFDLYVYDVSSRTKTNITESILFNCGYVSWSPSSNKIAFWADDDIYIVNSSGTGLKNLTNTPKIKETSPSFSPQSEQIIYVKYDTLYHMMLLDLNTEEKIDIVPAQKDFVLYNTQFTWSSNAKEIVFNGIFKNNLELKRFRFDNMVIETIYIGNVSNLDWYNSP